MNEKFDLEKFVDETCKTILSLPIDLQNETFANIRRVLINERRNYLEREYTAIKEHQERTDYASKTLETVLMSSFNDNELKKCVAR